MAEPRWLFELTVDGTPADSLRVVDFHGREALSEGCQLTVRAEAAALPDLPALPGRRAVLTVRRADGTERRFHGVVVRASVECPWPDAYVLTVTVAARLALLRLGRDCRIFQQKSVPEVVRAVLEGAGLRGDAQAWLTRASYEPHAQIVQFNESDYDFVRRLLAAEGVGFMVRQLDAQEQVIFFDAPEDFVDVEGGATLVDRDATQLTDGVVWDVRERLHAASDRGMLRDYDPARPAVDLTSSHAAEGGGGREVYEHPGGYLDDGRGRRLARRLVERLRVGARVLEGSSDEMMLEPGRRFTVNAHPRASLNLQQVAWEVEHRGMFADPATGEVSRYENAYVALPATVPFRPAAAPLPPPVAGVAFVTAPPGEEMHTEAFGRVKVRFPWDRSGLTDDRSSTWLRVGQLALGGSMVLPRQGFEVLVDHEFGDRDRPMVAGHLYNAEAMPPYELPGYNARTSLQSATYQGGPGANELRFDDSAGAEEMFLNASKDFTLAAAHDTTWRVNHNQTYQVGANRSLSVGTNHIATVTGDRRVSVGGNREVTTAAQLADTVGGAESLTVGAMRHVQCGGDHNENTAGALDRTVGSLQSVTGIAGVQRTVVGDSSVTVGAAMCQIAGGSLSSSAGGSRTQLVGALKLTKARQMSVSCKTLYTENGAAESVKCGGARVDAAKGAVAFNVGGGVSVKANGINLEAKSKLVVIAGGCMITLSPSSVTVKAANIDLTGAKGLNQVMHKGN